MPKEIRASRQRAVACRGLFVAVVAAVLGWVPSAILHAQSSTIHGYITAVHPPDEFDLNGEHVTTNAETRFGTMGTKNSVSNNSTRDAVQIGAWVEVSGKGDRKAKTVTAQAVLFRDDRDQKLSGMGAVDKVISTSPELVFAADGYRIRVTSTTVVSFPHDMKSAADVRMGLWVLYEGKLGQDGLLLASKVRFLSTKHAKEKSENAPGDSAAPAATTQPPANSGPTANVIAQPPNNAASQTEIQVDDRRTEIQIENVTYMVTKDQALRSRVQRIGMSLVPAWQKQLPADDPAKIRFYFIAVKDDAHEERANPEGLILVPVQLAERCKNDDQLAAVIADGIAYGLQQQAPTVFEANGASMAEYVGIVAASLAPLGYVAESVGMQAMHGKAEKAQKEQLGRVALELMVDAGYDPWQAPEAWRLAAPGKLPADIGTLKYPDRSGYQLSILNRMYKKPAPTQATESGPTTGGSVSEKP
jgi:hypothetical protein